MPQYTWEIAPCQEGAGFTLLEKETGNLMHSAVGPWAEANQVYVGQSELERRSLALGASAPLVIYDVGMGIAANSLAAIEELEHLPAARAKIYSFERFPEALAVALQSPGRFEFMSQHVDKLRRLLAEGTWRSEDSRIEWNLLPGDFRDLEISALSPADLVYFDFYAPAKCPELWTYAVFKKLHAQMVDKPGGLLITYASSKAIRAAMLLAGFFVGEGPATSMKLHTTLASTHLGTLAAPIGPDWLMGFDRSPKQLPADWPASRYEEGLRLIHEHTQFKG